MNNDAERMYLCKQIRNDAKGYELPIIQDQTSNTREIMNKILINIEDIENAPDKTIQIDFEEFIEGIKSDEPIKASLEATSLGEFIEITGNVEGCVRLECDLCLEEFEYNLDFEIDELFAKNTFIVEDEEPGQEIELKSGEFVTDLKGSKDIDISDLLYQSVILDFPNKKVCGINCKGGDIFIRDETQPQEQIDPRMAIFKDLKVDGK